MDLTEVRSGAMKSSLLVWKMIMGECRPWLVTSLLIYVAKIKHFLVQDSTCAAAATEKVRTPESNPLFVRLFSGFCYFSPDTAPHNLIFAPVSNVRGNNYKKAARVPVSVSPVFHLRHQRRRLVDNDWGRAGQSILSSGPWGVVKTWIENNCQMLKMSQDPGTLSEEWNINTYFYPVG